MEASGVVVSGILLDAFAPGPACDIELRQTPILGVDVLPAAF
jgi:hypothetical protein